ncbi:MAG: MoaD/ThiS family protein [Gemmatimonadales bacterium]
MPSPRSVTVTVRFLARYSELVGRETVTISAPDPATVDSILARLGEVVPEARRLTAKPLCAHNFRQVRGTESVADGDEIALLPPMAGG